MDNDIKNKIDKIVEHQKFLDECKSEIDEHVCKIAFEYSQINKQRYYEYPTSESNLSSDWIICNRIIEFPWSDSWSYGGHAEGTLTVPIEYFYDAEAFDKYRESVKNLVLRSKIDKEEVEKRNERQLYEDLKKKYDHKTVD